MQGGGFGRGGGGGGMMGPGGGGGMGGGGQLAGVPPQNADPSGMYNGIPVASGIIEKRLMTKRRETDKDFSAKFEQAVAKFKSEEMAEVEMRRAARTPPEEPEYLGACRGAAPSCLLLAHCRAWRRFGVLAGVLTGCCRMGSNPPWRGACRQPPPRPHGPQSSTSWTRRRKTWSTRWRGAGPC